MSEGLLRSLQGWEHSLANEESDLVCRAIDEITALRAALDQMSVERRVGDLLHAKTVAALAKEREKASQAAHLLTQSRIWGGMNWVWNPLRGGVVQRAHALLSGRETGDATYVSTPN